MEQKFNFTYDDGGKRQRLKYFNGANLITETVYGFDTANRLENIQHLNSLSQILEQVGYTYNANGDRISMNRPTVNLPLPNPVSNTSYNSANQMLSFNDKNIIYDENGNIISVTNSCGTTNYTWNARNQLVGINGFKSDCSALSANFKYDALNRRIEKTINGTTTQYVYDGLDIVQEIENGVVTVNYIRTLNIDEPLARIKADGTIRYYRTDALGSVIALVDDTGAVKTTYSYDPFGNVTVSGESSDNPFQYTGRENDGTGLYYYRARYYSPELQRFISEDPIEFLGGDINLYSYVWNLPTMFIDPLGLAGIYVDYSGYPVNTGYGFNLPLGHAAVVAVDPNTGTTKYYEYGRYDEAKFGLVRNQKVPNLVMKDGDPTAESLANLYKYISEHYGKGRPVDATYYSDANYQKIVDFALKRMRDKNRDPYSIWTNNCKTFARDAIDAGRN